MGQSDIKAWIIKTIKADGGVNAPLVKMLLENPDALAKIKAAAGKEAGENPSPEELSEDVGGGSMSNAMEARAIITTYLPAYVWANVSALQKNSQPVPGAPKRDFMPQTDDVNWTDSLRKGEIDIVPPHGPGTEKEAAEE